MQSNYSSPRTSSFSLNSLFYAYFLTKDFSLFGFFFFPFPLISKTSLLNRNPALERRKRKRMYHKTPSLVKHLFLFYLFFLAVIEPKKTQKNNNISSGTQSHAV